MSSISRRALAIKPASCRPLLDETSEHTCAPGDNQLPSKVGIFEFVAVRTMSILSTASRAVSTAVISKPSICCIDPAKRFLLSSSGLKTTARSMLGIAAFTAAICPRACPRDPRIPTVFAPFFASHLVPTAVAQLVGITTFWFTPGNSLTSSSPICIDNRPPVSPS